ncbi:MAG: TetR/AcrR family transcriptional regulator [Pseudomonadota bacterium]
MRVKTEARREAILKVASEVFLETGYQRASMAEISSRVGGSKATLYSYFPSKEALFVEVTLMHGQRNITQALSALQPDTPDLAQTLQSYGESVMELICSADAINAVRIVIAESGNSDIGRNFYASGPKQGDEALAAFLALEVEAGRLRRVDPSLLSTHFTSLLDGPVLLPLLLGVRQETSGEEIKQLVADAVSAFLAAYGT